MIAGFKRFVYLVWPLALVALAVSVYLLTGFGIGMPLSLGVCVIVYVFRIASSFDDGDDNFRHNMRG